MSTTFGRTFDSWLQYFRSFRHSPSFQNLVRLLNGEMHEHVLSALSNNGDVRVFIEGPLGKLSYDRTVARTGARMIIEEIEFISHRSGEKGFSFSVVGDELSVLRYNGSDPQYSPQISIAAQEALSVFLKELRLKVERFLQEHSQ